MIGGIVMAAGLSERMGGPLPKQLLPIAGKPMVAVTVSNAVASELDLVVVVTGHCAADVEAAVADSSAIVVNNPDYREGNMTSLRTALRAIPDCDAYLLLVADMPGVTPEIIDRMVEAWGRERPWAAVAEYLDGVRHPLLLSRDAMNAAMELNGPKAVWQFLDEAPDGMVMAVALECRAPRDVNEAADYDALTSADRNDSAE
jgi:molybdenum cofactor cytidylyltransferase